VILLARVDNRLIHGQILETWVPTLGAREVLVVDDEAAASPLARAALTLCVPPEVSVRIEPAAAVAWADVAASRTPTLVVLREVGGLARARANGLTPQMVPVLNVGNVHFAPDRRSITASVFLSREELDALRELERAGFRVETRPIPAEAPLGLDEVARRYAANG